jgi:hypothetical protein
VHHEESLAVGDTIKHTDLSEETPGSRAIVEVQEHLEVGGEVLGSRLTLKAKVTSGSPLSLALAGCVCAITLFWIGVPGWAAACVLPVPAVIYAWSRGRPRS